MTPGEHRALAEELDALAKDESGHALVGVAAVTVARAQVHATLALAAAIEEQTALAHGAVR